MSDDITVQLIDAASRIDQVQRADLQILLRKAAIDIKTLRKLLGIRDEVWLETVKPEGKG